MQESNVVIFLVVNLFTNAVHCFYALIVVVLLVCAACAIVVAMLFPFPSLPSYVYTWAFVQFSRCMVKTYWTTNGGTYRMAQFVHGKTPFTSVSCILIYF